MDTEAGLPRIALHQIDRLLRAQRGVLVVAERRCPRCRQYERELLERLRRNELPEVEIAVLDLDGADAVVLPYTLLFHHGRRVDSYAGTSGAPLLERFGSRPARPSPSPHRSLQDR